MRDGKCGPSNKDVLLVISENQTRMRRADCAALIGLCLLLPAQMGGCALQTELVTAAENLARGLVGVGQTFLADLTDVLISQFFNLFRDTTTN
jgi:hypothetical protein